MHVEGRLEDSDIRMGKTTVSGVNFTGTDFLVITSKDRTFCYGVNHTKSWIPSGGQKGFNKRIGHRGQK